MNKRRRWKAHQRRKYTRNLHELTNCGAPVNPEDLQRLMSFLDATLHDMASRQRAFAERERIMNLDR